VERCLDRPTSC